MLLLHVQKPLVTVWMELGSDMHAPQILFCLTSSVLFFPSTPLLACLPGGVPLVRMGRWNCLLCRVTELARTSTPFPSLHVTLLFPMTDEDLVTVNCVHTSYTQLCQVQQRIRYLINCFSLKKQRRNGGGNTIIPKEMAHHVERLPPERLPWQTYSVHPTGRPDIGCPRRRWRQQIL
jgi:hypothetical protein